MQLMVVLDCCCLVHPLDQGKWYIHHATTLSHAAASGTVSGARFRVPFAARNRGSSGRCSPTSVGGIGSLVGVRTKSGGELMAGGRGKEPLWIRLARSLGLQVREKQNTVGE